MNAVVTHVAFTDLPISQLLCLICSINEPRTTWFGIKVNLQKELTQCVNHCFTVSKSFASLVPF